MDGISSVISIILLLLIATFILAAGESLVGIIGAFVLLVITSYITVYNFTVTS
uniref:Uncharacterized protein n=1 Tax=viral metagenome TaxID=1070528 RepID=A0A6C0HL50_9ZZZZ